MADFNTFMTADARLVMLRALSDQEDDRLNETILTETLKAFGYRKTRDWVRTQLRIMADLGAVILHETGGFLTAEITELGEGHIERSQTIDGIRRPSRR